MRGGEGRRWDGAGNSGEKKGGPGKKVVTFKAAQKEDRSVGGLANANEMED